MKGTEWLEMRECGTCGKRFPVLYPHLWRFKRPQGAKKVYFCSYGCVRKFDQKGVEKVELSEKARKALEIAVAGGDPIGFLKEEGSKNPSAAWHSIKMQAKEKDPETFAKLPEKRMRKKKETEPKAEQPAPKISTEVILNAEGLTVRPVARNPEDIFEKLTIRSAASGMTYKRAEGGMTMILDGKGVFLNRETWTKLAEEIPKALRTLGVDS